MENILDIVKYEWKRNRIKHEQDASDETFVEYINSLDNMELLQIVSTVLLNKDHNRRLL